MNDTANTTEPMIHVSALVPLGSLRECFRSIQHGAGHVLDIDPQDD